MTDRDLTPEEVNILDQVRAAHEQSEKEFAQAIGMFAIRFSNLETNLDFSIGRMLRIPDITRTIVLMSAIRSVDTKIDILSSLFSMCNVNEEMRLNCTTCVNDIREINRYRNWLLHGMFDAPSSVQTDGGFEVVNERTKIRTRTDSKFRVQTKTLSANDIAQHAKKCDVLSTTVSAISDQVIRELDKTRSSR